MPKNNERVFHEIDRVREVNPMAAVTYAVAMNGRNTLASMQKAYHKVGDSIESAGEILGILADFLEELEFANAADELRAWRDAGPLDNGEDPRPGEPGMPTIREVFTEEFLETFDFKHSDGSNVQ